MMSDIRGGVLPAKELEDEKEVALAARYGAGRTTVQKARMKVLSEFRGGNSDNCKRCFAATAMWAALID